MIDDSSLFHGTYDPVKAREYYLRNRKLKGRKKAAPQPTSSGRPGPRIKSRVVKAVGQKPNRANTKSRRAELEAQKKALEKRLDRLRDILAQKVIEAKKLSKKNGSKPAAKDDKSKAPETKADKADRNADEKSRKPLTAAQKSKKAKAAKEAYEKEHPNSLSDDIDILREQIKDVRVRIQKIIDDAKEQKKKANKPKPPARR